MTIQREDVSDRAQTSLLSARGLSVSLGGKRLVRDLDVDIAPGQRWCVLGPNGSGKTTLLSVLPGMRTPDEGDVRLEGRAYSEI